MGNLDNAKAALNAPKPHVPQWCMINGCTDEATKWIDTDNGFSERGMITQTIPDTFYLCGDHASAIANEDYEYNHLRIDTKEIHNNEIGEYSCHDECKECNP
jgi:hypothetical protein